MPIYGCGGICRLTISGSYLRGESVLGEERLSLSDTANPRVAPSFGTLTYPFFFLVPSFPLFLSTTSWKELCDSTFRIASALSLGDQRESLRRNLGEPQLVMQGLLVQNCGGWGCELYCVVSVLAVKGKDSPYLGAPQSPARYGPSLLRLAPLVLGLTILPAVMVILTTAAKVVLLPVLLEAE